MNSLDRTRMLSIESRQADLERRIATLEAGQAPWSYCPNPPTYPLHYTATVKTSHHLRGTSAGPTPNP